MKKGLTVVLAMLLVASFAAAALAQGDDEAKRKLMIGEKQKVLVVTMLDVDPANEEDLNRWFNEEHLPALQKVPGVLSVRRYRVAPDTGDGGASGKGPFMKYLMIYEHESIEVQKSEAYQKARSATPWSDRVRPYATNNARQVYIQVYP